MGTKDFIYIVLLSVAITLFINILEEEEMVVNGRGNHLVIMLHGVGGRASEFDNLVELFQETRYTVLIPSMRLNLYAGLESTTNHAFVQIANYLETTRNREIKKVSIIGHSLGGVVAKMLLVKISQLNRLDLTVNDIEYNNFITIATPHLGISGDYWPLNLIRILLTIPMVYTGIDLRDTNLLNRTETNRFKEVVNKFNKRSNYVLSTLDLNVPAWSSRFDRDMELQYDTINPKKESKEKRAKLRNKLEDIRHLYMPINDIHWDNYIVPIHTLLNHANIIGKYVHNSFVTWNQEEVINSMNHIRSQFK